MNLIVILKMAPDTVEELAVAPDQKSLDTQWLRFKLGDSDEHALEAALLLREQHGGTVTVAALEAPEVDDVLFTALAKGANRAVKLAGDLANLGSWAAANLIAAYLTAKGQRLPPDTLVLIRSQGIDDLEGEIGPCLADQLGVPYVSVVTGVSVAGNQLVVVKEFAGGLRGEFELSLPAVLGIQSAEKPPRYVPIAKVRSVMKSARIEMENVSSPETTARFRVARMYQPEIAGRAEMLEGTADEIAERIIGVLAKQSLI